MRSPKLSVWKYSSSPEKTWLKTLVLSCVSSSPPSSSLWIACFGSKWLTNMQKLGLWSREAGYFPITSRRAPVNNSAFATHPIPFLFWIILLYFTLQAEFLWRQKVVKTSADNFSTLWFFISTLTHTSRSPLFAFCFYNWYFVYAFNK